jgi:DNA-binding transcriptional MocR family regulator
LRVGFVVAARPLLRKIVLARWNADGGAALLSEIALTTLIRSGDLERHLRRMRKLYASRLAAMIGALRDFMPAGVEWQEPAAGHGVWMTLPRAVEPDSVFRDAASEGILYTRGDVFHVDGQGASHCDLSFARLSEQKIVEGVERFATIVRRHLRGGALVRGSRRVGGGVVRSSGGGRVANR